MFDFGVGYSEMFVLAIMAILVIGPKDLPKVMRTFGQFMAKARGMAREFQGHVDQAMKETGVDDIKKQMGGSVSFPDPNKPVKVPTTSSTLMSSDEAAKIFEPNSVGEARIAGVAVEKPAT